VCHCNVDVAKPVPLQNPHNCSFQLGESYLCPLFGWCTRGQARPWGRASGAAALGPWIWRAPSTCAAYLIIYWNGRAWYEVLQIVDQNNHGGLGAGSGKTMRLSRQRSMCLRFGNSKHLDDADTDPAPGTADPRSSKRSTLHWWKIWILVECLCLVMVFQIYFFTAHVDIIHNVEEILSF
jgi:hypothetical protein